MGGACQDKALFSLGKQSALQRLLSVFQKSQSISTVMCVARDLTHCQVLQNHLQAHRDDQHTYRFHSGIPPLHIHFCQGGNTRSQSALNALKQLHKDEKTVMVHDVARCLLHPDSLKAIVEASKQHKACVLAVPLSDTLAQAHDHCMLTHLPRQNTFMIQTPQIYPRFALQNAYEASLARQQEPTDESSAFIQTGDPVYLVMHSHHNPKLTTPADVAFFSTMAS